MIRDRLLTGLAALLTIVVIISILVLAGVYFLPSAAHFETVGMILATVGTIFATFLAWRASEERQARRERKVINRLVARGDAIATELMMVADHATEIGASAGGMSETLGTLAQASIVTIAEIQPHLAAALSANLLDLDQLRQKHIAARNAPANDPRVARFRQDARDFAFRTEALAAALQSARRELETGQDVSRVLLQRSTVEAIAERRGSTIDALAYVGPLARATDD